jgi:hypothetical protein
MNMPGSLPRKSAALLLCAALLGALVLAAPAGSATTRPAAGSPPTAAAAKTRSRGPSYMTGIGDEWAEMFGNPLWQQLHTRISRDVVPYDAAVRPYWLRRADEWIHEAETEHQRVLVAFYHSEATPTKMPSVAVYKRDVAKFMKLFPHVREYEAWDEVNRGDVPGLFSSPSAVQDAQYYQALKRDCISCTVVGLDVLDAQDIYPTLDYIAEFKREIYRLQTVMPTVWGLHNYSDINRYESWRTRDLVAALGGEVWLTETGGIVQFGSDFPNKHGSGLKRAAKVLQFMFGVAASNARIKRLYVYDWTGGTSKARFDAGLMSARYKPRAGYVVVCEQLHAAHCNVKTVDN